MLGVNRGTRGGVRNPARRGLAGVCLTVGKQGNRDVERFCPEVETAAGQSPSRRNNTVDRGSHSNWPAFSRLSFKREDKDTQRSGRTSSAECALSSTGTEDECIGSRMSQKLSSLGSPKYERVSRQHRKAPLLARRSFCRQPHAQRTIKYSKGGAHNRRMP